MGPSTIFKIPAGKVDVNMFRSNMAPSMTACWDVRRKELDYDLLGRLVAEFEKTAPSYLGDYYPLTSCSLAGDTWLAWQFHRPRTQEGVAQPFRRGESTFESGRFKLHGLLAEATGLVSDSDMAGNRPLTGRHLIEEGLPVSVRSRPGAVVVHYQRQP